MSIQADVESGSQSEELKRHQNNDAFSAQKLRSSPLIISRKFAVQHPEMSEVAEKFFSGIDSFLDPVLDVKQTDVWFSPSAFWFAPWLRLQGIHFESLRDLIELELPAGVAISPHPFFQKMDVLPGEGFESFIKRFYATDSIVNPNIFDVNEYLRQHKDLRNMDTPEAAKHFLEFGVFENRLKYLDIIVSTRLPQTAQYSLCLKKVLQRFIGRNKYVSKTEFLSTVPKERIKVNANITHFYELKEKVCNDHSCISLLEDALLRVVNELDSVDEGTIFIANREVSAIKTIRDVDFIGSEESRSYKKVLYCVNIGGYDQLPVVEDDGFADFEKVLITDSYIPSSLKGWTILRPSLAFRDVKRRCLWYKTHPHWLFPNATHTLWVDSNVMLRKNSRQLIAQYEFNTEVATFMHPDRDCVYEELNAIRDLKMDTVQRLKRSEENLIRYKMPEHYGLFETNLLLLNITDFSVRKFLEEWWNQIFLNSRRDQLSFTVAAWRAGVEITPLDGSRCAKDSRFVRKTSHKKLTDRFRNA